MITMSFITKKERRSMFVKDEDLFKERHDLLAAAESNFDFTAESDSNLKAYEKYSFLDDDARGYIKF